MATPLAARVITWYYLAGTPLFLVADVAFGVSVRAAFLDEQPLLRFLYYGVAFVCGLLAVRQPAGSGIVGVIESGANIALVVFGIMLGYLGALDAALAEMPMRSPVGGTSAVNLTLSVAMLVVSYTRASTNRG
jgi:hypothetical protein